MCNKTTVAVVIPIYKSCFTDLEEISFKQAIRILGHYDTYFVMPESLQLSMEIEDGIIKEVRFADDYFRDIASYNRLLLTQHFYKCFRDYDYILIYQLDAFVFEDMLEYFCGLGYDYIGAPWINGYFFYKDIDHVIWEVGNGGFSLRKVDSILRLLEKQENILQNGKTNEDIFFSSAIDSDFFVAPKEVALQFSIETEVRKCMKLNGGKLPFGSHAWSRYDFAFWKPHIEAFGYSLSDDVIKSGIEDEKNMSWYEKQKRNARFWKKEYNIDMLRQCMSSKFEKSNKQYVIWGAGYWGRCICAMLKDAGERVELFIDGNPALHGTKVLGCKVIGFEEFCQMDKECNVIVALWDNYNAVLTLLEKASYVYKESYITLQDIELIREHIAVPT